MWFKSLLVIVSIITVQSLTITPRVPFDPAIPDWATRPLPTADSCDPHRLNGDDRPDELRNGQSNGCALGGRMRDESY